MGLIRFAGIMLPSKARRPVPLILPVVGSKIIPARKLTVCPPETVCTWIGFPAASLTTAPGRELKSGSDVCCRRRETTVSDLPFEQAFPAYEEEEFVLHDRPAEGGAGNRAQLFGLVRRVDRPSAD